MTGGAKQGSPLGALKHRDFRLIAIGNMVSQLGFWGQYVAVGWTARELTNSDFLVTVAFGAQWLPALLLGSFAGVAADRYDRRKLVLWGKTPGVPVGEAALKSGKFEKLSIANPKLAPYGAAGMQVLAKLGLTDALAPKLVQGNNIAQAFLFVDTGNAELGFVALSQVNAKAGGQYWLVPASLYDPILQDAVLLKKGEGEEAARAFLAFLKGPEALKVIEKYGYGLPSGG